MSQIIDIKPLLNTSSVLELLSQCVYMPTKEKLDKLVNQYKKDNDIKVYGYEYDGLIVGLIAIDTSNRDEYVIIDISVNKLNQHGGLGRKLILYVLEHLNPTSLIAETDDDAVNFYRNCGFTITNLGEKYPGVIRYSCRYEKKEGYTDLIHFKLLDINDLLYLHQWLNDDHVIEWYEKRKMSFKEVEEKYIPRINGEKPVHCFLIMFQNEPIGYIQTYYIHDFEDYARSINIDVVASGVDLFIGEPNYIHKGFGKHIIKQFLKQIVFKLFHSSCCIIGPDPNNIIAIKTYERVGFNYIKTIEYDDEQEYIMRINKDEFLYDEQKTE